MPGHRILMHYRLITKVTSSIHLREKKGRSMEITCNLLFGPHTIQQKHTQELHTGKPYIVRMFGVE